MTLVTDCGYRRMPLAAPGAREGGRPGRFARRAGCHLAVVGSDVRSTNIAIVLLMSDEEKSDAGEGISNGDLVRSLIRGLAVLRVFSHQQSTLSVTEVAEKANLSRAAARRLLLTLEHVGYVQQEHARFSLRPKVLELGYAYLSSLYPWDSALPVMQRFSAEVDENCLAGVLDFPDVVCVARTSRRFVNVSVPVGGRLPAYSSSMGRVLLASMDRDLVDEYVDTVRLRARTPFTITNREKLKAELVRVKEQGWSIVDHEVEEDVVGVAVPIRGVGGQVVAALNVSAHDRRITAEQAQTAILPGLLACSRELSLLFASTATVH